MFFSLRTKRILVNSFVNIVEAMKAYLLFLLLKADIEIPKGF